MFALTGEDLQKMLEGIDLSGINWPVALAAIVALAFLNRKQLMTLLPKRAAVTPATDDGSLSDLTAIELVELLRVETCRMDPPKREGIAKHLDGIAGLIAEKPTT
jgi:hypothetical protein